MELKRYLFDSPSSVQIQIGTLDTSVKKEESTQEESIAHVENSDNILQSAENIEISPLKETTTSLNASRLLDIYA